MRPREERVVLALQADEMKKEAPFILWRMIFQEIFSSFLAAFFFFFVVFLINQVLLFAEDILSRGADFISVMKLLFYSLPTIVAITIPFSVLAAALMTSSRQNSDNEFLASSTLGIKPLWLYIPFILIGIGTAIGAFYLNDWSMPRAALGFKRVYAELIRKSAKIELTPYSIKKYGDNLLVTGPSSEKGQIQNILIIDQKAGYDASTVTADNVGIRFSDDSLDAILSMENVTEEKKLQNGSGGDFSITQAESATMWIQIQEQMANYSTTAPSEMSLSALARRIREKEQKLSIRLEENKSQQNTALDKLRLEYNNLMAGQSGDMSVTAQGRPGADALIPALGAIKTLRNQKINDTSLQIYRLEYQKKFVIPSACFFFAFLAFPLGIGSKRAGRTAGFGLALLLSVIYWALLFIGQTLGYRQNFNPILAMWLPNLIMFFAAILVWLFRKMTKGHFL